MSIVFKSCSHISITINSLDSLILVGNVAINVVSDVILWLHHQRITKTFILNTDIITPLFTLDIVLSSFHKCEYVFVLWGLLVIVECIKKSWLGSEPVLMLSPGTDDWKCYIVISCNMAHSGIAWYVFPHAHITCYNK